MPNNIVRTVRGSSKLSRRAVLRGAGGVALALPALGAMEGTARAAPPTRFILIYQSQGMFMDEWQPRLKSGAAPTAAEYSASDYDVNTLSADLAPHKDDILFITGLDNKISGIDKGNGNAHEVCFNHLLTGRKMTGEGFFQAGGPSIDHVISTKIYGAMTPRQRILHLGPVSQWHICYSARNAPISREQDAASVVNSLFTGVGAGGVAPDPALEKIRLRKKRLLDSVRESANSLRQRLGGEDRTRVDSYLNDLGEISSGLATPSGSVAVGCGKPVISAGSAYEAKAANLTSVAAMALACDLTRVITMDFGGPGEGPISAFKRPDGKPLPTGNVDWHQDVVHRAWQKPGEFGGTVDNIAEAKMNFRAGARYLQGTLANVIAKVKSMREVDGTSMLDHTAILYVNEFGEETHGYGNHPFIIAGKAGGKVRPGRWLRPNDVSHQRLLLAMLAMHMPTTDPAFTSFGEPAWNTGGPLPGLGG